MTDHEFFDFCLDLAVKSGRVQKRGNLARNEDDTEYLGEVTYHLVLN